METLPVELMQSVVDLVDRKTLLNIIRVNYTFYMVGVARLFSDITFYADPYTANLTLKSTQLLSQLYGGLDIKGVIHHRMRLVRKVTVLSSPKPCFRVTPHAFRTLNMIFFQLLQNSYIQSNLQSFQWRMGFSERLERSRLSLPVCLRALECVACQVDKSIVFSSLERLAIRRMRNEDGEWISRQIQHSNLKDLYLSGISDADRITVSSCIKIDKKRLGDLKHIGLECFHIDAWPWPPSTRLEQLTLKFCSQETHQFRACTSSVSNLEAFTLVSDDDVLEWAELRRMLWSCKKLKTLALLLAGRTSKLPLSWIRPMQHSLETLVLEARLSSITPALNYEYTIDEVNANLARMPNLKVLGLPISIDREVDTVHLTAWKM